MKEFLWANWLVSREFMGADWTAIMPRDQQRVCRRAMFREAAKREARA